MGKIWDKILRRKSKDLLDVPARTFIITLNQQRLNVYCRNTGTNPRDPNVIVFSTHDARSNASRGYHIRSQDKVIVLEDADFGHGWQEVTKNVLLASEGWVDLRERKEVWT